MIEIISIEDQRKPKVQPEPTYVVKKPPKPQKPKHIRKFLAEHFEKIKSYNLDLAKFKPRLSKKDHNALSAPSFSLDSAIKKARETTTPAKHKHFHSNPPKTHTQKSTFGEKIWNFLQLISTTAVIFAIVFVVMNWSAYQVIFEKKVSDFLGLTDNSQLEKLAGDKQVSQDLLPIADSIEAAKEKIPALLLDVTPPDTRVVIPRINKNVPVVDVSVKNLIRRDWDALEKDIQESLRSGVVHYPGTAMPGENGKTVITGHSSYFPWDPGRFKDVFALLHDIRLKDRVVVYYQQKKYIYEVTNIKVVLPEQVEVLNQGGEESLTLLTCTPVGTNLKRLIIEAKPV